MNSDIGIQIATLTFINHMLNALNFDKEDGNTSANTVNGNNNSATPNIVVTITEPSTKAPPTELEEFMDTLCDSIGILYILEVRDIISLNGNNRINFAGRNKHKSKVQNCAVK